MWTWCSKFWSRMSGLYVWFARPSTMMPVAVLCISFMTPTHPTQQYLLIDWLIDKQRQQTSLQCSRNYSWWKRPQHELPQASAVKGKHPCDCLRLSWCTISTIFNCLILGNVWVSRKSWYRCIWDIHPSIIMSQFFLKLMSIVRFLKWIFIYLEV